MSGYDTVVIGGGQAGLAVGHHLARLGCDFVILDEHARVGDVWRERYDSLRLYSPAKYDGLPGMPFPAPRYAYPSGAAMADYLESYADRRQLPVRTGVRVDGLWPAPDGEGYDVCAGAQRLHASQVVVATGGHQVPAWPDFADELDPEIRQLHSSDYRNPSQLRPGAVLVVGAAHSGADVALEVAAEHETWLSGAVHGQLPFDIEGRLAHQVLKVMWFAANHVLTMQTPLGRKVRPEIRAHGGPLLRVRLADLAAAGVHHVVARTVAVRDGRPMLADGQVLDVANIIWCTGFRPDFDWIHLPVIAADGWPEQERGVVPAAPGLYFVGLIFQYAFASMLVGGVGRDAAFVARQVAARSGRRVQAPRPMGVGSP